MLGVTPVKANLDSGTMRWVSVASTLTLATVLSRLGSFKVKETVLWRGAPDTAIINGKRVRVGIGGRVDAIDRLVGMLGDWNGLTITLGGRLRGFVLEVDVEAYADWELPIEAGITNIELVTLAEPRGFINDVPIGSFHDMVSIDNRVAGVVWGFLDEASGVVFNGRRLVDYINSIIIMNGVRTILWGRGGLGGLLGLPVVALVLQRSLGGLVGLHSSRGLHVQRLLTLLPPLLVSLSPQGLDGLGCLSWACHSKNTIKTD